MSGLTFHLHTPTDPDKARALHDGLVQTGETLRTSDLETFLLTLEDEAGALCGGCKGDIAFRSAHIAELWVDETYQGQGLGRQLLHRAETHALARNCIRIHLETRSEVARALYQKVGYRVFGQLSDYKGSQAFYYLEKRLD
ncbi:N-acetyltransferase [Cognatishimia sp. MH4019]|uniref:GNAT family N-acetyltransferase n=1 Tax=Cognatishimia sp. MH4019 TaxID=2854030 RepID=UPI001CD742F8|nr:GNAT family N-acetyltransferase [Cognatishimia sp. MH4019]